MPSDVGSNRRPGFRRRRDRLEPEGKGLGDGPMLREDAAACRACRDVRLDAPRLGLSEGTEGVRAEIVVGVFSKVSHGLSAPPLRAR